LRKFERQSSRSLSEIMNYVCLGTMDLLRVL
jgi:hypothetical protein